jgi:PAS domain S-box-containing protein
MKVLLKRLEAGLRSLSPVTITTIALCWVLALGIADCLTPRTVTLIAFYFLAVVFAGWGAGKWQACFVSAAAAITTFTVYWVMQRGVPHSFGVAAWNNATRFVIFSLTGWLTAELTRLARNLETQVEERTEQWRKEAEEHKLTATRLTDTIERFEQVINNITEVFWLTDVAKSQIVYISPGYEHIWGRQCQELYREPASWLAAVHPDDWDTVARRSHGEQAAGGYEIEYRIMRPDGAVRWVRDRAFPVRNAQGKVCRIAGVAEDITERKQTQQTLQMQAAILENMAEAVVVTDEQGLIVQMNPAAEKIWGYERNEVLGKTASVFSALAEPEATAVMRGVLKALAANGSWRGTFSNKRKDGTLISCEALISRVEIHGRVFMAAVEQDVTERRRAETVLREAHDLLEEHVQERTTELQAANAALRETNAILQAINQGTDNLICVKDTRGKIIMANPAMSRFLDKAESELIGTDDLDSLPDPQQAARIRENDQRIMATGRSEAVEETIDQPGRRWHCLFTKSPYRDADGHVIGTIGIGIDITERKRMDEALREAHDKLEQRVQERTAELQAANAALGASEERYRSLVNNLNVGVYRNTPEPEGHFIQANPALARIHGYESVEEFEKVNVTELYQDPHEREAFLADLLRDGTLRNYEVRLKKKDGTPIAASANATVHRDCNGRVDWIDGMLEDITQRKKAEQSLAEALEFNRQVVSASSVGIGVYKASGQCVMANHALARITGGAVEQLLAQDFRRIKPWETDGLLAKAEAALETRQPQELECESRTTFGQDLTVSARFSSFVAQGELHLLLMLTDQTAARLTRDALRVSEERYRTLAESSPDAIFILDRDIQVEYVNSTAAALWRRAPGELAGLEQPDLFPPEIAQRHEEVVRKVFATGMSVRRDEPLAFPTGDQWIEIRLAPLYDAQGSVTSVMGVCRDITERKRAERLLTEALDLNQKMLAAATVGVSAYKASGECIFANEALARIVGGRLDDLLQANFREAKAWHQSGLVEMADEALNQGQAVSREIFCETRFGKSVWLDCHMASFVSNGKPHLLLMALDISERKQAGAALRQAERLQKALLDNIPDPAWLKDAEGRFLACNQALARFYGQPVEAIIGKTVFDFLPREADRLTREDRGVMHTRRSVVGEAPIKNAEGAMRWLESIKSPLCNERDEVIGMVGIARDVTERKQTESVLQAQRDLGVTLSTTSDVGVALRRFLEFAVQTGGFDCGGVYLVNPATQGLDLAQHCGTSASFARAVAHFAVDSPQMSIVRQGRPVFTLYEELGIPFDEVRQREALQAFALLPLHHEQEIIGALVVASHMVKHIPPQTQLVMEALATQGAGALARIRAEAERHRLERQLLEITDREQARIGQDIHDGLCQHLVSMAFDANSLARELSRQRRAQAPMARRMAQLADQAITETRQLARGLFPVRLESEGLPSALEELAKSTRDRFKVRCLFRSNGTAKVPSSTIATHLYRIAQEAVANAVKHSQARVISIDLSARDDQLWLKVQDDGTGLRPGTPKRADGMGLHIMDYRARSIGGTLRLAARPRGGTLVFCCVPCHL